MASPMSETDLQKAKEAINLLSSLVNPAPSCGHGSTSRQSEEQGATVTKSTVSPPPTSQVQSRSKSDDHLSARSKGMEV